MFSSFFAPYFEIWKKNYLKGNGPVYFFFRQVPPIILLANILCGRWIILRNARQMPFRMNDPILTAILERWLKNPIFFAVRGHATSTENHLTCNIEILEIFFSTKLCSAVQLFCSKFCLIEVFWCWIIVGKWLFRRLIRDLKSSAPVSGYNDLWNCTQVGYQSSEGKDEQEFASGRSDKPFSFSFCRPWRCIRLFALLRPSQHSFIFHCPRPAHIFINLPQISSSSSQYLATLEESHISPRGFESIWSSS